MLFGGWEKQAATLHIWTAAGQECGVDAAAKAVHPRRSNIFETIERSEGPKLRRREWPPDHRFHQQNTSSMNLPLDFNSAEPWTRIVKIAVIIAAVYAIAVVGLFGKGNFLGGAILLVFGLVFYFVLRRARRV